MTVAPLLCALLVASHAPAGGLAGSYAGTRVRGHDQALEVASGPAGASRPRTRWASPCTYGETSSDRANQYNGRVYDAGTGFHDYGARLYWPAIGRFISADSYGGNVADPASLNRYSYVHNNPYKYTDPTGCAAMDTPGVRRHVQANAQAYANAVAEMNDPSASLFSKVVAAGKAALALLALTDPGVGPAAMEFPGAGTAVAKELILLNKSLASEAQVAELANGGGKVIAGAGHPRSIDDIARLVAEHGGSEKDWVKVVSGRYKAADGTIVETHAYRNVKTGKAVEPKSKLPEPKPQSPQAPQPKKEQ